MIKVFYNVLGNKYKNNIVEYKSSSKNRNYFSTEGYVKVQTGYFKSKLLTFSVKD